MVKNARATNVAKKSVVCRSECGSVDQNIGGAAAACEVITRKELHTTTVKQARKKKIYTDIVCGVGVHDK